MMVPTYNYIDMFDIMIFRITNFFVDHMQYVVATLVIQTSVQQFVFEHFVKQLAVVRTRVLDQVSGRVKDKVSDQHVPDRSDDDETPDCLQDQVSHLFHGCSLLRNCSLRSIWFQIVCNDIRF